MIRSSAEHAQDAYGLSCAAHRALIRRAVVSIIAAAVLQTGTLGGEPNHASAADERDIRALVQNYVDARNSRNAEATRALFTHDADQLVSTGEWRKGIDGLVRGMMATSQNENAKSSIAVESVRFLDREAAIVDGRYETSSAQSGTKKKMWTTLVVTRTVTGWRIAAIRNMLPSKPPTP